jgi:hypothetical protein
MMPHNRLFAVMAALASTALACQGATNFFSQPESPRPATFDDFAYWNIDFLP